MGKRKVYRGACRDFNINKNEIFKTFCDFDYAFFTKAQRTISKHTEKTLFGDENG